MGLPQFDPTWFASQLFWLGVACTFLYFTLSGLLLPPLQGVITRRQQQIEGDLSQAEAARLEAEEARDQYERALSDARVRAQSIFADMEVAHRQREEHATHTLEKALASKNKEASTRIAAAREELFAKLKPQAADMAVMMAEKLANVKLTHDQAAHAVDAEMRA